MKRNNKYQVLDVKGFEEDLFKLSRKYPLVLENIEELFENFELGIIKGNPIPRLKLEGNRVYKTELKNPDANKGAKGGFRVIWYLVTSDNFIYPLTIYSKSDQEDISPKEIMRLISKRIKV